MSNLVVNDRRHVSADPPITNAMPPELAAAIVQVMGSVTRLKRSATNKHGNYKFASIDAFLEAIGPLCAEAGIFFLMHEVEVEVLSVASAPSPERGGNGQERASKQLRVAYDITIYHSSGKSFGGIRRNVAVVASGAQAYGSAQSYVLKQFMRSLFQVPTGDNDDADYSPADEIAAHSSATAAPRNVSKNAASRALYAELEADVASADSIDALKAWASQRGAELNSLPNDWRQSLRSLYANKMNDLLIQTGAIDHVNQ